MKSYFDAKRELKKIYGTGLKAIKKQDAKYINFLLSELDQLENSIQDKDIYELDRFGMSVIKKDIKRVRAKLNIKFEVKKKPEVKKPKGVTDEKKSAGNI